LFRNSLIDSTGPDVRYRTRYDRWWDDDTRYVMRFAATIIALGTNSAHRTGLRQNNLAQFYTISIRTGLAVGIVFADISGHDDLKWAFDRALSSPDPIHILLEGPVGTGKTRFIKAIEKRYHELSYFALGSGATGAGMINQCFEIQPRFLLIDEIEDLRQSDQASLLSLMQDGVLTETKVSKTRRIEFKCSVFATCNQLKRQRYRLSSNAKAIFSRMFDIDICNDYNIVRAATRSKSPRPATD
jgi:hypothetical protein